MAPPDPYAILRNGRTLQAHRERMRMARRAGQPFLAISLGCYALIVCAFAWAALTEPWLHALRTMVLPMDAALAFGGVCFAIAGVKISLWLAAHPTSAPVDRPGPQAGL